MQMLKYALVSLGIALLGIVLLLLFGWRHMSTPAEHTFARTSHVLMVGEARVKVEIAATPEERQRGLSGRTSLPEDEGMLFMFEQAGRHAFWMPDMHFAIDIIWFDDSWHVVSVKENATPESYPESFVPDAPARFVLEVPAGFARAHGIVPGATGTYQ